MKIYALYIFFTRSCVLFSHNVYVCAGLYFLILMLYALAYEIPENTAQIFQEAEQKATYSFLFNVPIEPKRCMIYVREQSLLFISFLCIGCNRVGLG